MAPEFMSDAFDDLRDDYLACDLDPVIAELCDACPAPVAPTLAHTRVAYAMLLLAAGMTALFYSLGWTHEHAAAWGLAPASEPTDEPAEDEPITGYMSAEQRKNVRHRLYRDGIRNPPRRETAAERVAREASEKWGHA